MIYLDHNATTPLLPEVAEAMTECARRCLGNPASQHAAGRRARQALEDAREGIAALLGARLDGTPADQLVFTSGGTEANNLAMFGLAGQRPAHLVVSAIEHPSVESPADVLAKRGWHVDRLGASADGRVMVERLTEMLRPDTRLVTVMLGNNETGVLQPVHAIADLCQSSGVPVFTDAVQVAGKLPVDFRELGVAALSIAAHKFHGPVGIGALVVRAGVNIEPQLFGGFQQAALRPGTEPVTLAVGMHAALAAWRRDHEARLKRLESLREQFERTLLAECPALVVNGASAPRLPQTSNIMFPGVDGQAMVMALDLTGVCCSTGSACASGSSEPSPTLLAMGLDKPQARSSLRFSFGVQTTADEVAEAAGHIVRIYREDVGNRIQDSAFGIQGSGVEPKGRPGVRTLNPESRIPNPESFTGPTLSKCPPVRYNERLANEHFFDGFGSEGRTLALTSGVVTLPLAGRPMTDEIASSREPSGHARFRGSAASDVEHRSSPHAYAPREFVAGPENLLAISVLRRLLDGKTPELAPDASSNGHAHGPIAISPLVLHGVPGTGKSHLAQGLAAEWQTLHPDHRVVCVTAADFARQYVQAIEDRAISRWRLGFREVDLLVLEDLTTLASKPAAQTELLHALDAIADRLGLVVVTSRLAPHELRGLAPALQSRLSAGLSICLTPPEAAARRAIVARLVEARELKITDSAVRLLADSLPVTVPELAGAIASLALSAEQSGKRGVAAMITEQSVRELLAGDEHHRAPTLQNIARQTARYFTLHVADLKSPSRRRTVVVARDVAMYLARQLSGKSLKQIGQYFGGRDHTTVLHGCRKTESLMQTDPLTHGAVAELRQGLAGM